MNEDGNTSVVLSQCAEKYREIHLMYEKAGAHYLFVESVLLASSVLFYFGRKGEAGMLLNRIWTYNDAMNFDEKVASC